MEMTLQEQAELLVQREARNALFIGIDHHGAQLTVAVARGQEIALRATSKPGYSWITTRVFEQDGLGYKALLEHLETTYPDVPREHYRFVSEPSYAKPCCHFLLSAGLGKHQVLWVDTRKVGQFRKAHNLGAGKSDVDDARAMLALLYHASTTPGAPLKLLELPNVDATAELLSDYAADHERLSQQMVMLQGKILQLVLLLFPELRRVWGREMRLPKPGGGTYVRVVLSLFDTVTPLRLLAAFSSPRQVVEAGFEGVWSSVGGTGVRKSQIRRLVDLAGQSGGLADSRLGLRLRMLIAEYQDLERRKQQYKDEITALLETDPVMASLQAIPCLGPVQLATMIGAIGDARRFADANKMKRFLNVAPMPLPQSGDVDERGRPVQRFRFPANSYQTRNGQRQLTYQAPGRKDVRNKLYLAVGMVSMSYRQNTEDPFTRYYLALKATHQAKPRWVGRVRWKVAAKLVETVFYCLKYQRCYDPNQVIFNVCPQAA